MLSAQVDVRRLAIVGSLKNGFHFYRLLLLYPSYVLILFKKMIKLNLCVFSFIPATPFIRDVPQNDTLPRLPGSWHFQNMTVGKFYNADVNNFTKSRCGINLHCSHNRTKLLYKVDHEKISQTQNLYKKRRRSLTPKPHIFHEANKSNNWRSNGHSNGSYDYSNDLHNYSYFKPSFNYYSQSHGVSQSRSNKMERLYSGRLDTNSYGAILENNRQEFDEKESQFPRTNIFGSSATDTFESMQNSNFAPVLNRSRKWVSHTIDPPITTYETTYNSLYRESWRRSSQNFDVSYHETKQQQLTRGKKRVTWLSIPPHSYVFSNSTGGHIDCSVGGAQPPPRISWSYEDGHPVKTVSRLNFISILLDTIRSFNCSYLDCLQVNALIC